MSSTPDEEPPISADVAARVEQAERRRGLAVKSLLLAGSLIFGAGLISSSVAARVGHPVSALGLLLLSLGLLLVFPLAALAALLVGPSWQQRQDHWRLLNRETRRQATTLAARGSRREIVPSSGQERLGKTLAPVETSWRHRSQAH
jgi:hypothetical protein